MINSVAGVILLRTQGKEIDESDAVFRINMAPTKGFEQFVGTKTTFQIVNSHNLREYVHESGDWNYGKVCESSNNMN